MLRRLLKRTPLSPQRSADAQPKPLKLMFQPQRKLRSVRKLLLKRRRQSKKMPRRLKSKLPRPNEAGLRVLPPRSPLLRRQFLRRGM